MKHGYPHSLHTFVDKGFFLLYFFLGGGSHFKSFLFQLDIYGYYKFKDFVGRSKFSNNVLIS